MINFLSRLLLAFMLTLLLSYLALSLLPLAGMARWLVPLLIGILCGLLVPNLMEKE